MNKAPSASPRAPSPPLRGNQGCAWFRCPSLLSEHTHHHRVGDSSHLEHVHGDLCAVGDLIAARGVGWREVEVGAVWLPEEKVRAQSYPQLCNTACATTTPPSNSQSPQTLFLSHLLPPSSAFVSTWESRVYLAVGNFASTQLLQHICHLGVSPCERTKGGRRLNEAQSFSLD